jgi:methionine-rich copper-binding protein CopC
MRLCFYKPILVVYRPCFACERAAHECSGQKVRLELRFVLAIGFNVFAAQLAHAHAILTASTPVDNQTVQESGMPVELQFNCRIDVKHSRLWLVSMGEPDVVLPLVETAPSNMLRAEATHLQQGGYRLRWQVLSVDGHITRGEISFRVSR